MSDMFGNHSVRSLMTWLSKKEQAGNDHEKAQSETNSNFKNRGAGEKQTDN